MDWLVGLMYYLMEGNFFFVMPKTSKEFGCSGIISYGATSLPSLIDNKLTRFFFCSYLK
jgi:hypothetical protein